MLCFLFHVFDDESYIFCNRIYYLVVFCLEPYSYFITTYLHLLFRYEFKTNHEEWVKSVKPRLGRGVSDRVFAAMKTTHDNIKALYKVRTELRGSFQRLLKVL